MGMKQLFFTAYHCTEPDPADIDVQATQQNWHNQPATKHITD